MYLSFLTLFCVDLNFFQYILLEVLTFSKYEECEGRLHKNRENKKDKECKKCDKQGFNQSLYPGLNDVRKPIGLGKCWSINCFSNLFHETTLSYMGLYFFYYKWLWQDVSSLVLLIDQ